MWNLVKGTLVCLFLGVVFSSAALAANQHKTHKAHKPTQAVIFVFDSTVASFASYLSPGKGLWSGDLSLFFPTKRSPEWTLVRSFAFLFYAQPEPDERFEGQWNFIDFAQWQPNSNPGWDGRFSLAIFSVYQYQALAPVPEASAGLMMAMGLPLVAWLVWRRRRSSDKSLQCPC